MTGFATMPPSISTAILISIGQIEDGCFLRQFLFLIASAWRFRFPSILLFSIVPVDSIQDDWL